MIEIHSQMKKQIFNVIHIKAVLENTYLKTTDRRKPKNIFISQKIQLLKKPFFGETSVNFPNLSANAKCKICG